MPVFPLEVELRGPLDSVGYERLLSWLRLQGTVPYYENRLFIDYSTFTEGIGGRRLDIRVRMTNGRPELVVKRGAFGGPAREEAVLAIADSTLDGAIRLMALLGYRRGVACDRGISRYRVSDVEVAIQEVRTYKTAMPRSVHSRFFELEIIADFSSKLEAELRLRSFAASLGLVLFDPDQWNAYVEQVNREANGVFDFDTDCVRDLVGMGMAPVMSEPHDL